MLRSGRRSHATLPCVGIVHERASGPMILLKVVVHSAGTSSSSKLRHSRRVPACNLQCAFQGTTKVRSDTRALRLSLGEPRIFTPLTFSPHPLLFFLSTSPPCGFQTSRTALLYAINVFSFSSAAANSGLNVSFLASMFAELWRRPTQHEIERSTLNTAPHQRS